MEFMSILPIAWVFLSLGDVLPVAAAPEDVSFKSPLCPGPETNQNLIDKFEGCPCREEGQGSEQDIKCLTVQPGYDGELTAKYGKCKGKICVLPDIPLGCKGVISGPKDEKLVPQIGCTYTCFNQTTNRKEFNYIEVGTPCQHALHNGSFELKTCQKKGNVTLCQDEVGDVPSC
uniref:Putative secreted protein n=1 Tax=Amblyomma cajennense TaxID=34607 RepID=A0A023FFG0_AMBCJ